MDSHQLVASDLEAHAPQHAPSSLGMFSKVVGAAAAVGLFCAGGWAGEHLAHTPSMTSTSGLEYSSELTQIIAKPGRDKCSSTKANCFATGCCNVAGYNCFTTTPGMAKCMKNCTPSAKQSCTQPQSIMDPILRDAEPVGTSLYCFAVYTKNTGSPKPNLELENLKYAREKGIHIFACDQYDVFADVETEVGLGLNTIQVFDQDKDWHFAKRKESGAWVNTGMFTDVWRKIKTGTKYSSVDWVAKVDGDAVFIPNRLKNWLASQLVPAEGVYLENCKNVDYGYFGNLEVFSKAAFARLLVEMDGCKQTIDWKKGVKDGKFGPMGEDLFAQVCLDSVGVRRIEAFDISTDGACPADRPVGHEKDKKWKPECGTVNTPSAHPFKKPQEFIDCHWATVNAFGN